MKIKLSLAVGSLMVALTVPAHAELVTAVSAGPYTLMSNTVTYDFGTSSESNSGPVVSTLPANVGGARYAGGELFNMNNSNGGINNMSARPAGSTGNYWSIQGGQVGTVTFAAPVSYYGFLWGSPDALGWNSVTFYQDSAVLGTFGGTMVPGGNAWSNARFFNVSTTGTSKITFIRFTASQNAFETDNHAFITAVPEPETYVMLLAGLGLLGLMARRRQQDAA